LLNKKVPNASALIWKVLMVAEKNFRCFDHPQLLAEYGIRSQKP
jgi:hypothetical protein